MSTYDTRLRGPLHQDGVQGRGIRHGRQELNHRHVAHALHGAIGVADAADVGVTASMAGYTYIAPVVYDIWSSIRDLSQSYLCYIIYDIYLFIQ